MPSEQNQMRFVLSGNGPITNRGCQAILNGTCKILEQEFGVCSFLSASFAKDPVEQLPSNVVPLELPFQRYRWSRPWWEYQMRKVLGLPDRRTEAVRTIRPKLSGCHAMLSVGGDNYAIDYGIEIVERLSSMNECAKSMGIPVIIWGASIGPFSRDKAYEERMQRHLSQIDLIIVRESVSQQYLRSIGIERNVVFAPDPAFAIEALKPSLPPEIESLVCDSFIGLNFSPILAKYVTNGNLDLWRDRATQIVTQILNEFDKPVLLIPHVISPSGDDIWMDDALFLKSISKLLDVSYQSRVRVSPPSLSCEQVKWVISKSDIFVGARMHSTLAAFSTGVPCISLAYSQKAWGMNEWLFGNNDWVLPVDEISSKKVVERIDKLIQEKIIVRALLEEKSPQIRQDAFGAASYVSKLLNID